MLFFDNLITKCTKLAKSKPVYEKAFFQRLKAIDKNFTSELKFHPTRQWRFDYANPDRKIAIEIEGGVYTRGRHTRGKGYTNDCYKYNEAQKLGWILLRYTHGMLQSDFWEIIEDVKEILASN